MTNNKEYIIYTRRIAYELRKAGFAILRVEPNPNKPEFDCYIFEDTDELKNEMARLNRDKGGSRNG